MAALEAFLIGGGVSLLATALLNQKGVPKTPDNVNRAKEALSSDPQFALDVAKRSGVDLGAIDAASGNVAPQELDLLGEDSSTSRRMQVASQVGPAPSSLPPVPIQPPVNVAPLGELGLNSTQNLDQDALTSLTREFSGEEVTPGAQFGIEELAATATGGGAGALIAREILKRMQPGAERVGDAPFEPGRVFDVPQDSLPGTTNQQLRGPSHAVVPTDQRSGTAQPTGDVSNRPITPNATGPAQIPGDTRQQLPPPSETIVAQQADDLIPTPPPTQTERRISSVIDRNEPPFESRVTGARGTDVTEGLISVTKQDGTSVRAVEVDLSNGESVLVDLEGNIYSRRGIPTGQSVDVGRLATAVETNQPRIAQILRSAARGL